jgi:hypothetical protein
MERNAVDQDIMREELQTFIVRLTSLSDDQKYQRQVGEYLQNFINVTTRSNDPDMRSTVVKFFGCFSHIIANETNTLISMLQKYNETRDLNLAKHIVHKAKWIGYMLNNKL